MKTKSYTEWEVGDIVAVDDGSFMDYLLISEVENDTYGIISLCSARLVNGKWERDEDLLGYESIGMESLDKYKYIG